MRDEALTDTLVRIHRANFGVYCVRKAWRTLRRLGIPPARDQVARLMRAVGLQGATRTKRIRTTHPAAVSQRPADLVERVFAAAAPNRLWVADLTYVWTRTGFVYTAFVVDIFSPGDRRLAGGGQPPCRARPRRPRDGDLGEGRPAAGPRPPFVPAHSVQYLSIRYTERLAEADAVSSVSSRGDSYDNALAETVNGLYKAELINRRGPWRSVEQVELATAEWVAFWNDRRLHSACGDVPPAEFEAAYHSRLSATTEAA